MNLDLTEKIFLVTGGSRGIGRAIAKGLLLEGAKVAIIARQQKGVNMAVSDLAQQFGSEQILGLVGDCADANSLSERVSELEKAWGGLDGVVANVGDGRSVLDPVPDAEQWSQVWQTNFETALTITRTCLPMLQARHGSLLFISSITGLSALGAPVDYSVAKTLDKANGLQGKKGVLWHARRGRGGGARRGVGGAGATSTPAAISTLSTEDLAATCQPFRGLDPLAAARTKRLGRR